MPGVEILDTIRVVVEQPFSEPAFWFTFVIVTLIGIAFSIWLAIWIGEPELLILLIPVLIIAALLGAGVGAWTADESEAVIETRYKVIVDDSANMNEFFEKYELIDTEGKILIVKEKE